MCSSIPGGDRCVVDSWEVDSLVTDSLAMDSLAAGNLAADSSVADTPQPSDPLRAGPVQYRKAAVERAEKPNRLLKAAKHQAAKLPAAKHREDRETSVRRPAAKRGADNFAAERSVQIREAVGRIVRGCIAAEWELLRGGRAFCWATGHRWRQCGIGDRAWRTHRLVVVAKRRALAERRHPQRIIRAHMPGPSIAEMRTRSALSLTAPELRHAASASPRHASRSPER